MGQSALGFAFGKLQTADVLQTGFVLAHLLIDDQLHTPTVKRDPFRIELNRIWVEQKIGLLKPSVNSWLFPKFHSY